jgi:hypothetical protein
MCYNVFTLIIITEKRAEYNKEMHFTLIDYIKGYDGVNHHDKLQTVLKKKEDGYPLI